MTWLPSNPYGVHYTSFPPGVPFQDSALANSLAMTLATIPILESSPFQADNSPWADVSAWAAEAISVAATTLATTVHNSLHV
jgi:hypothetical protein